MKYSTATVLVLAFVLIVTAGCIFLDRPPAPLPSSTPPTDFSAERAMAYLYEFAQKPHPSGSPEHARVRDYLLAQIAKLGLTSEVQRATGVTEIYQAAGRVENILTRLKGSAGSPEAVLLAAHYDSVVAGPGAADDGAGVAALLETLRALRAGPPLKNDIVFLFSDGEEEGMLGASAFVAEHPWTKDVRVAINLEARGNSGPSELFETSAGNGRLVQLLAQSAPHISGSSLGYEVYKHLPNDTDMTVFKRTAAGLNFAFISHWQDYHTPLDTPERLDRGSLQQHGEYALGLARTLGNIDLSQLNAPDASYFALPGGLFVHYSSTLNWPLAILVGLIFLGTVLHAAGGYRFRLRGLAFGLLTHLGSLALLVVVAVGFERTITRLHFYKLPEGDLVRSVPYVLSLLALLLGLHNALYRFVRRKLAWNNLFMGAAILLFIVDLLATKWFPGGVYAVMWPFLAMLMASWCVSPGKEGQSLFATIAVCLLALPSFLLLVPLLQSLYEGLGLTEAGAPALAVLLALFLWTLLPLLEVLLTLSGRLVPLLSFGAALLLFGVAAYTTRYDAAHPKPSVLVYALDADSGRALWASSANRIDNWTTQYVGTSTVRMRLTGFYPNWEPFDFLQHDAPVLPLPPPRVDLLENSAMQDSRTLRLRVTSARQAHDFLLEAPDNEIAGAWVDGRKLGSPGDSRWNKNGTWGLEYTNAPPDGIELKLQAKTTGTVKLVVVDRSSGLPNVPGVIFARRPADSMTNHSGDETLVRHSFVF